MIHGQSGLNLLADYRLPELDPREPLDTIIITGRGMNEQESTAVVDWLHLAAPMRGGSPPFAVAQCCWPRPVCLTAVGQPPTGGCWKPCKRSTPPSVLRGPLYIQDGPVWTSGGVSSGFDLTLALVEDDYGFSLARDVAQDMVMYLRRPGGQLQFSRYNLSQSGSSGPISELQTGSCKT